MKQLRFRTISSALLCALLMLAFPPVARLKAGEATFGDWWKNPKDSAYFPIAVWLQDPKNAERYKAAGINLYVGLWRGPNSDQVAQLARAGIQVISSQNTFALEHKDNPTFAAWMHGDEPDNAQSLGRGRGYGPPIKPERIIESYERIHNLDPSRPVLLNLGQAVAWDNYIGRGVRRNHPEDYPEYAKGCDIVSFDIYPVVHDSPEIRGKLEYVARGVDRLRGWAPGKRVWNCIECTHIGNPERKATPEQVRSEVWMSLIHGSQGIIYFVHQFKPSFNEAALLSDPAMLQAVTDLNRQIHELAPVLNSETWTNALTARAGEVPVATLVKKHDGDTFVFAVAMRDQAARCEFQFARAPGTRAEVLGESRSIPLQAGKFADDFAGYGVHLYRIAAGK